MELLEPPPVPKTNDDIWHHKANINKIMLTACLKGHMNIVLRMIKLGADDWHDGIFNACKGHLLLNEIPLKSL